MAKSFHELSSKAQVAVFGFLCALTVVGAWQVVLSPQRTAIEERSAHLATLEADVTKAQATAARLVLVQREVKALEVALQETTSVIPEEKDPQDVLRALNELASESMIGLAGFTNKTIVTKAQYSEWPVTLSLEGGYHDIGRFFDRIASTPRLISVTDLNIKTRQQPNGRGSVTATCTATTFVVRKDTVPVAGAPGAVPAPGAAAPSKGGRP
jgi:type IV pilus assembly protein PilO